MSTEFVNPIQGSKENQQFECLTKESLQLIFRILTHEEFDVLTHGWLKGFDGSRTLECWTIYLRGNWVSGPCRTVLQACAAAETELKGKGRL